MVTLVKLWRPQNCCGNTHLWLVFPQLLSSSQIPTCVTITLWKQGKCFLFLNLSPPQGLLQWGNGKKMGKRRENWEIKKLGACRGRWEGPKGGSVPHLFSFPFSPAPACFMSHLPIPQPTRKTKETSAEERVS